jgi:hypothetical protein
MVQVVDREGAPVEGATVSGEWSGSATDTDQIVTDSGGWASAYSDQSYGGSTYTFCVTEVSKPDWIYDSDSNVVTCGSSN